MFFTIYFVVALSSFCEVDLCQMNLNNLFHNDTEEIFSVKHRFVNQDITVGTLKTRFNGRVIMNGNAVWNFSAEVKSNGIADKIKPFEMTMESWVEPKGFKTLRFEKNENQSAKQKRIQIYLDQFNNRASWIISSPSKKRSFTGEILPGSRDLLTLLWLLRTMPAESLVVGKSWFINMVRERPDSIYSDSLPATISATEIVKIQGKRIECFIFEVDYKRNNFLGSTEKIRIWLDREHQIIMIKRGLNTLVLKK